MIFDLVVGGNLMDYIVRQKYLPEKEAAKVSYVSESLFFSDSSFSMFESAERDLTTFHVSNRIETSTLYVTKNHLFFFMLGVFVLLL